VYDKKMLWRANLYVDETLNQDGSASGAADWNNLNPWNDPVNNAWYVLQANGADVDGGQIRIKPWTSIYTYFNLTAFGPLEVHNAVAYSLGCDDTPAFFNQDLDEQKNALKTYYNSNNNTTVAPNPAPGTNRNWATWTDTLAPLGEWENYVRANPANTTTAYSIAATGGTVYYPYTPGFSSYRVLNGDNPNYYFDHTQYSAGTECQGLVTRAAGYAGNNYTANSSAENDRTTWIHTTGQGIIGLDTPANWTTVAWPITNTNDLQTSLVVPGDIIIINGHMGIVYKIEYAANSRNSAQSQIHILEAYGRSMTVFSQRDWLSFYNATQGFVNPFCQIMRLKVQ
jgi:hypothetical protein